jgi:hypothetical protein
MKSISVNKVLSYQDTRLAARPDLKDRDVPLPHPLVDRYEQKTDFGRHEQPSYAISVISSWHEAVVFVREIGILLPNNRRQRRTCYVFVNSNSTPPFPHATHPEVKLDLATSSFSVQ